ncbi:TonB-dependent receptor [Alistipes senegalensis]|uniref:TonB-dependent receptor plug domain-containing protein n=1 Tax=Alistipes senegalensis JC50 TaxID=1033732 RepID=A0ABY5V6A8_9BACT|nr:TonB-dependent receptor [Alistipes senegalensis]MCI7306790.1 TonB-dependent receptor plug domain-containing protein [Alistipes senegalensis]MDD7039347.1 TonB-dependent receptor plug domain-containing protein [Alistipes senegalensis]UEA87338.1 TonB-dependent receptor plug domain-containing protein [Alistipes senegalensis]UWN65071.1 TonB-dependent receptor plug domain-containing protein [Alistipes senegalensis JC50]
MRKSVAIIALLLFPALLRAQSDRSETGAASWREKGVVTIREVPVWGRRPMKSIGVQETRLDSLILKENIALSIADVLTFNSPIFVKQYGRATLSTVSFRGTGPSHTQVTWNGMRINNPMLGMTDFSMIPSYFIDDASLLHGTSSVNETGGGLGGLVRLSTAPADIRGFGLQYIQGIGMFRTFDEFLRLEWGDEHWQVSTRAVYQSSANDFKYRNRDKKENIYDDEMNIVGSYYPTERNKSGAFDDVHVLQEVYYDTRRGDRFGLNAWYINSNRELPLLTTDYADDKQFENRQREHTLRSVLSWDHYRSDWKVAAKAGYIHTWMAYDYRKDPGSGIMNSITRSRNKVDTFYGQADGEYTPNGNWFFTAGISAHQHLVESIDKDIILQQGGKDIVGYDKGRIELSASVSAKWRPTERLGLSAVLREEMYGTKWATVPAFFADCQLSKRGNIVAKASVSRNHRFPTLNDLYFLPGGNPDLRSESGFSYEAGLSFAVGKENVYSLSGSASWYDQHIDDWILWLSTPKGFFSPRNIKQVHAYGVEMQASLAVIPARDWKLTMNGTFSWSPSINEGEPISPADQSVGKQLPYEPEFSATVTGRLTWRSWGLLYQFCYYSERYTMSSNDITLSGRLTPYLMNNLSLDKAFALKWADLTLKGTVNNLFNEEYLSVTARPMPRMNVEFFIGIRPKWGGRNQ